MAASTKSPGKLTGESLKNALWETMNQVREGKIDHMTANAAAAQAREILRTVRTQNSVLARANREPSKSLLDFAES